MHEALIIKYVPLECFYKSQGCENTPTYQIYRYTVGDPARTSIIQVCDEHLEQTKLSIEAMGGKRVATD